MLRDDAIKTLQQARDEYHDKLIEQEEMLESLTQDVENLRADIQERTDQVCDCVVPRQCLIFLPNNPV